MISGQEVISQPFHSPDRDIIWYYRSAFVALLLLAFAWPLAAQSKSDPTVFVSIGSRGRTSIEPGFAGYNAALMTVAFGYKYPGLAAQVRRLGPGWIRYPAGTRSEAFDWTTGASHQTWVDSVSLTFPQDVLADFREVLQSSSEVLAAKGGEHLDEAAALARASGARGLIICVNVFTDTPASAKKFAAYAKRHRIRVLAWELGNEPYFNPKLWPTSTAYANAVRPFAAAIREADANAKIGVSMSDAGFADRNWDDSLASFRPRYWDFVIYHHYPTVGGTPTEMIAALNNVLLHRTTDYVRDEVKRRFGPMPVMITEAGPQDGPAPGMSGTMYGGIWSAEYALRMSSLRQVKHFGIHQLVGPAGIGVSNSHTLDLVNSWKNNESLDLEALDFGLYQSAQGTAYALAAKTINSASAVYRTSVRGGGTAPLPDGKTMPAVFAETYQVRDKTVVVLTNKGARAEMLSVSLDERPVRMRFNVVSVSAPDPSAENAAGRELIAPLASVSSGFIPLPPYSVIRISW
jgi:hypothetical protein